MFKKRSNVPAAAAEVLSESAATAFMQDGEEQEESEQEESESEQDDDNHAGVNEGLEDFEHIDLGRQTLKDGGIYDLFSISDIPVDKVYLYDIKEGSQPLRIAYQLLVPQGVHLPAGELSVHAFDKDGSTKIGGFQGRTHIKEQHQGDLLVMPLGTTSLVRVDTLIQIHDKTMKQKDGRRILLSDHQEFIDFSPVKRFVSIKSTFKNHSSKHVAHVIARYPVPVKGKFLESSCVPSRTKRGHWEFDIEIQPHSEHAFECRFSVLQNAK
jgi:hypothetical protein